MTSNMEGSKIQEIIVKFLNKEANINELEKLDVWLKDDKNSSVFNHFVRTEYLTTLCMGEYNIEKAKESISNRLKCSERKRKMIIFKRISIAASVLLILGLSYFKLINKEQIIETPNKIEIGSDKAILTLENGNQIALEKGKKYQTGKANSNGEELVYAREEETSNEGQLLYNCLTIPRGGQFFVQLSDGTKVWLNSDSKLKYPIEFHKGKMRTVELVYGEAFFKVSPSTDHNRDSFSVLTKGQVVNVLGTEFNISAYNDNNVIATTLIEGKVVVQKGDSEKVLKPNQQSITENGSDLIDVIEIDASQEISWVNGMFTFNEEPLDEMMRTLSRWYDAEIIFESAERKKFVFTGILARSKSVEDLLKLIEATSEGEVKFEVDDKKIIIK